MTTMTITNNKCPRCGAASTGRVQFASGFEERFACGSKNHSDGFDQAFACVVEIQTDFVEKTESVSAPAGLLGDLTSLFLRADRREYTPEQLFGAIRQVCDQHKLSPISAGAAASLGMIKAELQAIPQVPGYALFVLSENERDSILARLNITIHEMRENA